MTSKFLNARNATDPGPRRAEPTSLSHIRIVLVETLHAKNIGSVARAMKVMGLRRLVLVNPVRFPHKEAHDLAAGADDVLHEALVCDSLERAIADCHWVYGASARRREQPMQELAPRDCAAHAIGAANQQAEIALVFGPESAGLDNHAMGLCQYLLQIPANPAFASLNLASAVQIMAYELRLAALDQQIYQPRTTPAPAAEFEQFSGQLIATAEQAGFFGNKSKTTSSAQLARLFQRMHGSSEELKMLRGLFGRMQLSMKNASKIED